GAQPGDYVMFDPPDHVGTPIEMKVLPVLSNPQTSSGFTAWTSNQFYPTVAETSTSGTGTGMSAFITVDNNGNPVAVVHDAGDVAQNLWTPNQTFDGIAQYSTTGSGSGMTINVTTDDVGHPTATVVNPGTGYALGDTIDFEPPDGTGDDVQLRIDPTVTQSAIPSGFKTWTPNESYPLMVQSSSTGNGTGMGVSVTVNTSGIPTATLLDPGLNESPGDVVTFEPPDGVGDPISVTITGQVYTELYASKPGYKIGDTVTFDPPDGVGSPITTSITGLTEQQQLNFNWTEDQAYPLILQSSSTGNGTGLTVNIVVDDQGLPTMTLNQMGTGYALGDIVTFNSPMDGAESIEGMVVSLGTITQMPGATWTPGATF